MTDDGSKSTLSTQGYRGTRDFSPAEQRIRTWLFGVVRKVLHSFGYEEYGGPFVEPFELYAAKSSEEIVSEQLYHFVDRGERRIAIRPEMTPTLARMVASRHGQLPRPIRWYSIPTCMRYERPQRGRLREFDQLNVDVFGGLGVDEDVEIILTGVEILRALGAGLGDFEVRVNHRGLVNDVVYGTLGVSTDRKAEMLRLLDKRDKLTAEDFAAQGAALGLNETQRVRLDAFLSSTPENILTFVDAQREEGLGGAANAHALLARLGALESVLPPGMVKFDASVMRGFDYYTGLVFEVYDTAPENRRALFGGGRYDNLVGAFGVDPLPGIGYGAGDVGLLNFCETHGLVPTLDKGTDVNVLRFSEADRASALALAALLRAQGLNVEAPLTAQKFGKQIQAAERTGARLVAFRGDDELKAGTFAVKWLASGKQETFPCTPEGAQALTAALRS
ncbi:MAG: histidine--tRNA ligase [Silvanigrellales bacterium]|jgi:histidyl-tRNA synthetase|nr:histidine--tRNA ligase [Silvanigrellales bacterium]